MKTVLTTKGFEAYLEKLNAAGVNIDQVADEALQAGSAVLLEGMQRRAPKLTGHLKGRIQVVGPEDDGNFHFVKVGIFHIQRPEESYFLYQEYGTPHAAAHPYMRPTFDEDMPRARAAMRAVFKSKGAL